MLYKLNFKDAQPSLWALLKIGEIHEDFSEIPVSNISQIISRLQTEFVNFGISFYRVSSVEHC